MMMRKPLYFCTWQYLNKEGNTGLGGKCNLLCGVLPCSYSLEDISFSINNGKLIVEIINDEGKCKGFNISFSAMNYFKNYFSSLVQNIKKYEFSNWGK